jgi:hypothetical protein
VQRRIIEAFDTGDKNVLKGWQQYVNVSNYINLSSGEAFVSRTKPEARPLYPLETPMISS